MAVTPSIIDVTPAPSAVGIPIGNPVQIIFNQEMDLDSINTGTVVLTGPDEAPLFGPQDVTPFDDPGFDDEDILSSPYFKGYVKGTLSFSKVDADGDAVDDDEEDVTGNGSLWRTVALFTSEKPLKPNVEYTAILLGDESPSDSYDTGIKTRTVFDTVFTGTGDGVVTFHGGYTGSADAAYTVEITAAGVVGTAEYIWWNDADPLSVYQGITVTGERQLENGVYITCDPDGTFVVGDTFQVVCKAALTLANNYEWSFTTGSGSVTTPPSEQSTSGIESVLTNVLGSGLATTTGFTISTASPEDGEYGIAIDETEIVFTFSADIDATTLVGAITVESQTANGDDTMFSATGDLTFTYSVSGVREITITLAADQLYNNNIVIVTLASTVADTDGNTLGSEYTTYYTTPYTPIYSSLRRVRLDLGSLISDVPDETIMLAILEASIRATAMQFIDDITDTQFFNYARREFVTCLAEAIIVRALLADGGASDKMSKRLGSLEVSRGGESSARQTLRELQDCVAAWQTAVSSGGKVTPNTSLPPEVAVKGELAEDAIIVGRQWESTSGVGFPGSRSAANAYKYSSGRRDIKTFRVRTFRGSSDKDYD